MVISRSPRKLYRLLKQDILQVRCRFRCPTKTVIVTNEQSVVVACPVQCAVRPSAHFTVIKLALLIICCTEENSLLISFEEAFRCMCLKSVSQPNTKHMVWQQRMAMIFHLILGTGRWHQRSRRLPVTTQSDWVQLMTASASKNRIPVKPPTIAGTYDFLAMGPALHILQLHVEGLSDAGDDVIHWLEFTAATALAK